MNCPQCSKKMKCVDSRFDPSGNFRYRRWVCAEHGAFNSGETLTDKRVGVKGVDKALRSMGNTAVARQVIARLTAMASELKSEYVK